MPWILQSPLGFLKKSHVPSLGYPQSLLRVVSLDMAVIMSPQPLAKTCRSRTIIEISPSNLTAPNLGGLSIGKPIKLLMQPLLTDFSYLPSLHTQLPTFHPDTLCKSHTHAAEGRTWQQPFVPQGMAGEYK